MQGPKGDPGRDFVDALEKRVKLRPAFFYGPGRAEDVATKEQRDAMEPGDIWWNTVSKELSVITGV